MKWFLALLNLYGLLPIILFAAIEIPKYHPLHPLAWLVGVLAFGTLTLSLNCTYLLMRS